LYYKGEKLEPGHAQNTDLHGYGPSISKRLSELIPKKDDLRVLDVGTGMAWTARFLIKHVSKHSHVTSLDPSEDVLTNARSAFSAKDRRMITFVQGSADELKFDHGSFDVVVSVMVMHHL
jgi:ubiquinone/menaquinone biosynthesis C-methylase UbiE